MRVYVAGGRKGERVSPLFDLGKHEKEHALERSNDRWMTERSCGWLTEEGGALGGLEALALDRIRETTESDDGWSSGGHWVVAYVRRVQFWGRTRERHT